MPSIAVPDGFRLIPWDERLVEAHARVLHDCFEPADDSRLFPCFRSFDGCLELIRAIRGQAAFSAAATWLAIGEDGPVGTVQGLLGRHRIASVQNLGVLPEYRGLGVGTALLSAALAGFRRDGATRVGLEVTAANHDAVGLYRRLGFRSIRTLYKAAPRIEAVAV